MNFATWDSVNPSKRYSAELSPAHVIIEFERTKKARIFAHKLGRVDFSPRRDINAERQKIIEQERGNLSLNGFKYKNIGHVYSAPQVLAPNAAGTGFDVFAHGHPLGGTEYGGLESCSRMGLKCAQKEGATDGLCIPGKCVIGTLQRVSDTKWRYESANTYGLQNLPVVYYLLAEESVVLKPISRGYYVTYGQDGKATKIGIDKPASVATKIYLSPKFYISEDFLDSLLVREDDRLKDVLNSPVSSVVGIETRKENFIRGVALKAYPDSTEGAISNQMGGIASEQVRNTLVSIFAKTPGPWPAQCNAIINEEFLYRFARQYSGVEYVGVVYDRLYELFSSVIQITESSLSVSTLSYDKERISRPVYSRLPGISEAYRSDPAFSDVETPSQWLTSGVDDFLSKKKDSIASFYQAYLDPETCSALVLDWLAQHVGLTGELWNPQWNRNIKEAMIRNAFGWWDREIEDGLGNLTPKGIALSKAPFNQPEWVYDPNLYTWEADKDWGIFTNTWSGDKQNFTKVKLDEIEKIKIDQHSNPTSLSLSVNAYDSLREVRLVLSTDSIRINKLLWNGLIEAKGSLLAVAFLVSIFGLKAHSAEELQVIDRNNKILKPKNGLRNAEISASPLVPYKNEVVQVGTKQDAEIGNYTNQLIADVTRVSSVEEARNVFFRVPYYYNRDGKSWDRTTYIARNWMPSHLNVRAQYPYLSADLWAVGDGFFEPEVVEITEA